jgi:hypothetical protein
MTREEVGVGRSVTCWEEVRNEALRSYICGSQITKMSDTSGSAKTHGPFDAMEKDIKG